MKLLVFRSKIKNGEKSGRGKINFERMLYLSFVVTFAVLIVVQSALTSPAVRTFLAVDGDSERVPLGYEEYLYKEGEIVLQLLEQEGDENIKVLVNGDEAAAFSNSYASIAVKDGDVVEIDGSGIKREIEVQVISKSPNIRTDCVGKKVKVNSNVKKLATIRIE
ncbi:MAG: hypothetical protein QHH06_02575 [Clostridiales bacterium]|jgi:hypothetical protein|nr:hypothetical protein [Eubacteriales bacterium]MDH7565355.1 hypothetical protein [Clostridiales bacterium]